MTNIENEEHQENHRTCCKSRNEENQDNEEHQKNYKK